MYPINKSNQPASLVQYKREASATYKGMPQQVRDDLIDSLLNDQGHVCAYCMKRIKASAMRVEHWASRKNNSGLQLDYSNLLACCQGNEGQAKETYTCDKRKGDAVLKFSPSDTTHNIKSKIDYHEGGKIQSHDVDFNQQLNVVLNLNETRLVQNRKAALRTVQETLNKKAGTRDKREIQRLLDRILSRNHKNQYLEYVGFLVSYLEKKL